MVIYSVHEREDEAGDISERADKIFFVREGFAWIALVTPVLWLLYHRMWRILAGFIVLIVAIQAGVLVFDLGEEISGSAALVVNGAFAFLANDLRRRSLELKGYALVELVSGRDIAECEEKFFTEWLGNQSETGVRAEESARTMPGKQQNITFTASSQNSSTEAEDVIGLFPEPAK